MQAYMRVYRLLAPALLVAQLIALGGCGVMANAPSPSLMPANGVTQSSEQNGRFLAFVGPRRQHAAPFLGVPGTNFYALRSWIDTRNGETAHQLYVEDSYFGAERNWDAARDMQGRKLKFVPISKNEITCENGCSYAEEFGADLPEPLLRQSPNGLTVVFSAKSGAVKTIAVPGELIGKELAAVDAAHASLPTAAVAPPPRR